MTFLSRTTNNILRLTNIGGLTYQRHSFSTSSNSYSILSFFKKIFSSETSENFPHSNTPRIIMLPEKELQALCDRNFERQLNEIAEKAKMTAANTSKNLTTIE